MQCGVLAVAQALEFLTRAQIRAKLDSGQWQRPARGVLVTHNGKLAPEQRRWVGLLAAPRGSALAGATAAELGGLRGFESDRVWLVVPNGYRLPRLPGAVVLQSGQLGPDDVYPLRRPRRTTVERSVLDMAIHAATPDAARAPLLAAVQQRLTLSGRLRSSLTRRGRCARLALIMETIDDAEGGVHSIPERQFAQIIRRGGLPAPDRQRIVRHRDGRYYLDADWKSRGVSAEIHGSQHLEVANWTADLDRCNELTISGRRVLQFTSYAVRHCPQRVGEQLSRALSITCTHGGHSHPKCA